MYDVSLGYLKLNFYLGDRGLYWLGKKGVSKGTKAGYMSKDNYIIIRIGSQAVPEKYLVYFLHHGYWSDYDLINADGDPNNNGILNLLEEGETLVRLNNGLRYCPYTKRYYRRKYNLDLTHTYEKVECVLM